MGAHLFNWTRVNLTSSMDSSRTQPWRAVGTPVAESTSTSYGSTPLADIGEVTSSGTLRTIVAPVAGSTALSAGGTPAGDDAIWSSAGARHEGTAPVAIDHRVAGLVTGWPPQSSRPA